jgi:hypothetical protein
MKRVATSLVHAALVAAAMLYAAPGSAGEHFSFPGTRATTLGGAFVGLADDENALFYNPAGLARMERRSASLSGIYQYYSWDLTDINYTPNFIYYGMSLSVLRNGLGVTANFVGRGHWETFSSERTIYMPEGTSDFSEIRPIFYERYVTASYARQLPGGVSIGATGKYINTSDYVEKMGRELLETNHGVTFDIGMLYHAPRGLSFGVTVENILASHIDYAIFDYFGPELTAKELPLSVTIGIAYRPLESVRVAADARNLTQDVVTGDVNGGRYIFKRSYHVGCEVDIRPALAVRAGHSRSSAPKPGTLNLYSPLEYIARNTVCGGVRFSRRGFSADGGILWDDRKSAMEEFALTLRNPTLQYLLTISYAF